MILLHLHDEALKAFKKELAQTGPDLKYGLRGTIRSEALKIAEGARFLSSWSTGKSGHGSIPASIKVFNKSDYVLIRGAGEAAPHGYYYENEGKAGTFRHPVFGNREVWVAQKARPFFAPAFRAREAATGREMSLFVDNTFRKIGYV